MKFILKKIIIFLMWIVSKIYPYSLNENLCSYRNILYTMWISNFMGHVGKQSTIVYPCSLQGHGQKKIFIGNNTNIQSHCILGCWVKYGNQSFSPSLTIGNHCSIGEFNHISACNKEGCAMVCIFNFIGSHLLSCFSIFRI